MGCYVSVSVHGWLEAYSLISTVELRCDGWLFNFGLIFIWLILEIQIWPVWLKVPNGNLISEIQIKPHKTVTEIAFSCFSLDLGFVLVLLGWNENYYNKMDDRGFDEHAVLELSGQRQPEKDPSETHLSSAVPSSPDQQSGGLVETLLR